MSSRFHDKRYTSICSEKTLQSNEKGFFMQFVENVLQQAGEEWINTSFASLKNDSDRIRCIYSDAKIRETVSGTLVHVQEIYRKKSAEVSQARRLEAEKIFESGENRKALTLFSQSVLRAPPTCANLKIDSGISLALALWSRSEVLMRLKYFTLALKDIQLALKEGLHNTYKAEAFTRMAICYRAKGEEKRACVSGELAEKLLSDETKIAALKENLRQEYEEAKFIDNRVCPKILNGHETYPAAIGKIKVTEECGKGRYVVAAEAINTGETVITEPPYASCLLPDCFGTHCHHCFDRLEAPIGCPDCSSVAFCKLECRDVALKTYHRHECKFLDLLIGSGMSILSHIALRMITEHTPEEIYEISKNRNAQKIYSLCTLSEQRNPEDFLQRTLMAGFLLRILQMSGYFGYVDENVSPNENQLAVGELILFHLQMLQFNAHEVYETRLHEDHRFKNSTANYIAVAVYPTAALLNHDCYPCVSRHFVGKNIVLTTLRPLKPGDMIAENYGPIFTRRSLEQRQKSLCGRYWFACGCQACVQDWPGLDTGLDKISRKVKCATPKCTYYFSLPIQNETIKCPRCKNKVSMTENVLQMKISEEQFLAGFDCMENEEVDKGVTILKSAIDTFHKISLPPHRDCQLGQECLRSLLADSGNVYRMQNK